MPYGTVELACKVCGSKISIPWGRKLSPLEVQCSYGCYEIYPGVLSWNAKMKKLRVLRAEAVALLKRYRTYDKLVRDCQSITAREINGKIEISAKASPSPTKSSRKIPVKS